MKERFCCPEYREARKKAHAATLCAVEMSGRINPPNTHAQKALLCSQIASETNNVHEAIQYHKIAAEYHSRAARIHDYRYETADRNSDAYSNMETSSQHYTALYLHTIAHLILVTDNSPNIDRPKGYDRWKAMKVGMSERLPPMSN